MAGTLFVVATPIGNAGDITDRARRVLAEAPVVAAEDTRSVRSLFGALGLQGPPDQIWVSNHKFNERGRVDTLLDKLRQGLDVALVSDAGTPCISDPGCILVAAAAADGIPVVAVCGPSAMAAALSVCGFATGSFAFHGFLPRNAGDAAKVFLAAQRSGIGAVVWYESPVRVIKSMQVLADTLPDSRVCLCNDLTKKFERLYRGAPAGVLEELRGNPNANKGEYTLVVDFSNTGEGAAATCAPPSISAEALLVDHIATRGGTLKEAVSVVAAQGIYPKKALYAASLKLKDMFT
jgi:16S rRNA (cytidine1402-2'-O)-methyltransferase